MAGKKAGIGAYLVTPMMSVAAMAAASLVSVYALHLTGADSPVPVFVFFGLVNLVCMVLFAMLGEKGKQISRQVSMTIIGSMLFFLAGLFGKQNFQIEGFFFFALTGTVGGVIVHYTVGKILGPILSGRSWCAWAAGRRWCWISYPTRAALPG